MPPVFPRYTLTCILRVHRVYKMYYSLTEHLRLILRAMQQPLDQRFFKAWGKSIICCNVSYQNVNGKCRHATTV